MSKMSQMHAELTQEAYENGFDTLEEYLADKERAKAHEAWLNEKKVLMGDLRNLLIGMHASGRSDGTDYAIIEHALEFIAKGEM